MCMSRRIEILLATLFLFPFPCNVFINPAVPAGQHRNHPGTPLGCNARNPSRLWDRPGSRREKSQKEQRDQPTSEAQNRSKPLVRGRDFVERWLTRLYRADELVLDKPAPRAGKLEN